VGADRGHHHPQLQAGDLLRRVTSVDEIRMFKSLGAMGVVIGSSLYSGKIDVRDALEAAK